MFDVIDLSLWQAMGFLPGSHASHTLFPHETDNSDALALNQVLDFSHSDTADADVSESKAALNILAAGALSLHDVYLVHNSRPSAHAAPLRLSLPILCVLCLYRCNSLPPPEKLCVPHTIQFRSL